MTDFPSWHRHTQTGELKHFTQGPVPADFEPAGGHYDFQRGIWIDDEPEEEEAPKNKGGRPRKAHK